MATFLLLLYFVPVFILVMSANYTVDGKRVSLIQSLVCSLLWPVILVLTLFTGGINLKQ